MPTVSTPTVSDYVAVTVINEEITLRTGGDIDHQFRFSVPSNIVTDQSAVATWQLVVEGQPSDAPPQNLKYRLFFNSHHVADYTHHVDWLGAVQKVLPPSVLQAGPNHATVKITHGKGLIKFSDFVIHIHVNAVSAPVAGSTPVATSTPVGGSPTG
jgi:hypothetical protein